jgi:phosphatidylserine/phosphatidylglycerophosphate/cardiolipin synthase-like enzyme
MRLPVSLAARTLLLAGLALVLGACQTNPAGMDILPPPGPTSTPSGEWIAVYFTDPFSGRASPGPAEALAAAIDQARLSVDMAIYSISLTNVRDALIRAHRRGVQVRLVMESDNRDRPVPQALIEAGISVLGDRRESLMHNKFVVIDRSEVWTGSMNFTNSGAYSDHNHLLRIRSVKVAENFTREFEEMFVHDRFGPDVVADTPYPRLTVNGVPVEVYFSPDDGVARRLLELLGEARESIYFMMFSFTSDSLGEVIRQRAQAGVEVAGVMESEQIRSNIGTEFDPFRHAGLEVRKDGHSGQMHHKVVIIDRQIVVTGSYNFSNNAERRNDENVVIIFSQDLAAEFIVEFLRIFNRAQP